MGWFVCAQDYAKPTGWISMKFGGRMGSGQRKNLLNCGADRNVSVGTVLLPLILKFKIQHDELRPEQHENIITH